MFWLFAHERADEQAGGKKAGGDEEHGELQVPRSYGRIRKDFANRNAVKARTFDGEVGGDGAHSDLNHE